jgi:uncharacterized RmlC-like cupin family protein
MSAHPGSVTADVRVIGQGKLDDSLAGGFGVQRLAEITHLPTGIASNQIEVVTVPAGGNLATRRAGSEEELLHVIAGGARIVSGDRLDREILAGPGDTVLVPAGTTFRADNASPAEALQLILVRGS